MPSRVHGHRRSHLCHWLGEHVTANVNCPCSRLAPITGTIAAVSFLYCAFLAWRRDHPGAEERAQVAQKERERRETWDCTQERLRALLSHTSPSEYECRCALRRTSTSLRFRVCRSRSSRAVSRCIGSSSTPLCSDKVTHIETILMHSSLTLLDFVGQSDTRRDTPSLHDSIRQHPVLTPL